MRLIVALFLLLPLAAHAASVEITWQHPTQNVDGSSIPATGPGSLVSTRVEWGTCSGSSFGTLQGSQTVTAPATSATISGLSAAATYCFRAFSRNTFGEESTTSNVVARQIPAPVPRPPVLSSTVTIVWSHKRMGWGETLEVVGTAPVGTACGPVAIAQAGMYEIPRDAVTLHTPLRGGTPVTFCDWG